MKYTHEFEMFKMYFEKKLQNTYHVILLSLKNTQKNIPVIYTYTCIKPKAYILKFIRWLGRAGDLLSQMYLKYFKSKLT